MGFYPLFLSPHHTEGPSCLRAFLMGFFSYFLRFAQMDHKKRVYNDIFEMLPNEENPSPMVRINRLNPVPEFELFAKLEWFNPFGSVKDRAAWAMLREFEDRGEVNAK